LYFRNQRDAAEDIAKLIEEKISDNPNHLLGLAAFYLGTENGAEAKRITEKVIAIQPESAPAYQSLGFADRLNFDLEASVAAYQKALELNPGSVISKRSLAEMKRATGKSEEAILLFREVLEVNPTDQAAENGLVLSLFDAGKQSEAEPALTAALASNPNNFALLVGAAYWYAAHDQSAMAVELAGNAIKIEPRYSWAYIALGRALIQQKRPLEAEKILLIARQFSNFPTLNYEIASARMAAGFYREASDELRKSFEEKEGVISVNLGGRILKQGKTFTEILSFERLASIFEPAVADDSVAAAKLKSLLKFSETLNASETNEAKIADAADEFVAGEDKMKIHRSLFAANRLLEKRVALSKALQLTESAISKVDSSLDVPSPAAAVMADALYETRTIASLRGEILEIPNIPNQTLLKILRGRIEELNGWAMLQQQQPAEAIVRFKRAISILPEKSTWWRSSKWRLGDAFEISGNSKDALSAYLDAYDRDSPDTTKRLVIEHLYAKVNGNTEGLDQIVGPKPVSADFKAAKSDEMKQDAVETLQVTKSDDTKSVTQIEPTETTSKLLESPPISEPKTVIPADNVPDIPTALVETEKKVEIPETTKTSAEKSSEKDINTRVETPLKQLFEPIIITVPGKGREIKKAASDADLAKKNESDKSSVDEPTGELPTNTVPSEKAAENPIEPESITLAKADSETKEEPKRNEAINQTETQISNSSTSNRQRIVNEVKGESTSVLPECKLKFGQERISILSDGGSLGMFVGFEGVGGDTTKIRASSSSPNDVDIEFQPDVGVLTERAFFIFKSISTNKGTYIVTFESNCGAKEVTVTVR
jgi:tetratricopeptide (TPR) repeat protein